MRAIVGILATIIVLTGATLTVLALWGIKPISWTIIWKLGATVFIVCSVFVIIYIFYYLFFKRYAFKNNRNRIDDNK